MSNYQGKFRPGQANDNWNMAYELIKKNATVLDIGCSNGNFGEALVHFKNCIVDGVEPDRGDAKLASAKLRKVYTNNIEEVLAEMKKKDLKYDHVVFLDVIEHLYRPAEVLAAIKNILKPEGTVVFSIPNMGHQSVRTMLMGGDFEYGKTGILDNTHMHFYTEREINNIFNEAKYKITNLGGVSVVYNDEMLKEQLKDMGIKTPDQSLLEVLSSNNAHIYQYVGSASPRQHAAYKPLDRKFQSPEAKRAFEKMYEDKAIALERKYKQELSKLQKIIDEKSYELHTVKTTLHDLKKSRSYKLGRYVLLPARTLKNSVKYAVNKGRIYKNRQDLQTHIDTTYGFINDENKNKKRVDIVIRSVSHPTSSTFIRLISPFSNLSLQKEAKIRLVNGERLQLKKKTDVIIVQRTALVHVKDAVRLVEHTKRHGIDLFVDTDDAFGELDENHPQYLPQKERVDALDYVMKHAKQTWFSTEALKDLHKVKPAKVVRNTLDPKIWRRLGERSVIIPDQAEPLRMVYMGTITHDADFKLIIPVLQRLCEAYPDKFELHVIGVASQLDKYPWMVQHKPDSALYPDFVEWFSSLPQFDIGLSPLEDSRFNRNKSDIKCLDYLACGIRPVVSDVEAYKNPELDKLIVRVGNNDQAWYEALETEIKQKTAHRKTMAKQATKGFDYIAKYRSSEVAAQSIMESLEKK